jgi:hypothetical protein
MLQKSAAGMSVRAISEWLAKEHGVQAGKSLVASIIRRESGHRAESAKVVARTKLSMSITTDIDRTSRLLRRALIIAKRHQEDEDPGPWTKPARVAIDLIALRAKLAGIEQPDEQRATAIVVLPAEESD